MSEAHVTPIERPLLHDGPIMRSDLNEIRAIVWRISERQIALQRSAISVALICITCTVLSFVCTVVSVRAAQVASETRP